MRSPGGPSFESAEHFQEVVLRVCWQCVSSCVYTDARTTWYVVVKTNVGGLRLIELHIPVAIRLNLFAEFLSKADLSEGRTIGWERSSREGSCACK